MSKSSELATKLAELKRRIDSNEMTLEEANQILEQAKTPGLFENIFNPRQWAKDVQKQNANLVPETDAASVASGLGNEAAMSEKERQWRVIGDLYGEKYKDALKAREGFITNVQGGTNIDVLNKANRHDVNMAVTNSVSDLLKAFALKNMLD